MIYEDPLLKLAEEHGFVPGKRGGGHKGKRHPHKGSHTPRPGAHHPHRPVIGRHHHSGSARPRHHGFRLPHEHRGVLRMELAHMLHEHHNEHNPWKWHHLHEPRHGTGFEARF